MNEIQWRHTATGATLYATIRSKAGQQWNPTAAPPSGWFEAITPANWADYAIALTEGAGNYFYSANMPTVGGFVVGWYWIDIYSQDGASPAIDDTLQGTIIGYWDLSEFGPWDANVAQWRNATPVALNVNGIVQADAIAMAGSAVVASIMGKIFACITGTVSTATLSATTTVFELTTAVDKDYFTNRALLWFDGPLDSHLSRVLSYEFSTNNKVKLTLAEPLPTAPVNAQTFYLLHYAPAMPSDLSPPATIAGAVLDEAKGAHDGWLAGLNNAAAAPTAAAIREEIDDHSEQLALLVDLLAADRYIDTTTTPWSLVLIKAGSGTLTTGTVLLRQSLKDTSGANVTSVETFVGRSVAP